MNKSKATTSRQQRRRETLKVAKRVIKERGWPRRRLNDVWRALMAQYPNNPYERGGLFDRIKERREEKAERERAIRDHMREATISADHLEELRRGSPLHRPWWRRLIDWLRGLTH